MLNKLVQFALSQRLLLLLLATLLLGAGYYSVQRLPIDAFPDISPTQVKLIIKAPGMTPEEVESSITFPIEVELLGIPRQNMLRSVAKYALTDITIDFEEGTDVYWARQQVAERLATVWERLPPGVSGGLAPLSTPLGEMFMFTVEGEGYSLSERRKLLDWVIRPALRTVPGVADVNALGGYVQAWQVVPRVAAMAASGVSFEQLREALESNNRSDGAGRFAVGTDVVLVRMDGRFSGPGDILETRIPVAGGGSVSLGDIADVRSDALARYGSVTKDGEGEAVQGLVIGLRGANASAVVAGAKQKLQEISDSLPLGIELLPFYDRSELVGRSIGMVSKVLLEAIVLVMIILVLFLGEARSALVVACILPLAAMVTFTGMGQLGMSANLMSLGGLAIAIGILVDAAVVVVENIVARLATLRQSDPLPRLHHIYRAVTDVALPVVSGIVIIIIVFLPLLSLQGLEGKLFRPVATTIVIALSASMILSLTVIPVIASYVLKDSTHVEPWLPRRIAYYYQPLLRSSLEEPRKVYYLAAVLGLLAVLGFWQVGKTFMPTMDEGDLIVQLEKHPSISLQESTRIDLQVEKRLLQAVPEITSVIARTGSDELGMDPMGLNETDMFLVLAPPEQWQVANKDALIEKIRAVLNTLVGVNYGFTQPIEMRVSEMLTGSRGDVAVKIFGSDIAEINRLVAAVAELLAEVPGNEDVFASLNEGVQYVVVEPRRSLANDMGLSMDAAAAILRWQLEGSVVTELLENPARVPVLLRSASQHGDPVQALANRMIALDSGRMVPLSSVADVKLRQGPVSVRREQGQRFGVARANVAGRDLVGFVAEAQQLIQQKLRFPPGYRAEWGGEFENQQRASQRLGIMVPVALGLIFLILFVTFGTVRRALIVFINIPFALSGGIMALWLSGEYLSVPATVGFIALLGIAVLNGVVLVSCFRQLEARGMALSEVVMQGTMRRLRPVLMTAAIAALGLAPFLLASGPGAEIQKPLAIVVIGGLVSSTLLTLLLLPVVYQRFSEGSRSA
jgi:cobalt-zinc-cadmium resistance protein CzcA